MSPRLRRAHRLVELADSAERAARARAADAERRVAAARARESQAEARWLQEACVREAYLVGAADLEQRGAYLRTLRAIADAARCSADAVAAEEKQRAQEVVAAATERRKLELWRDRIDQSDRAEEDRRERIGADELAARITRSRA
jgi:hypothetical protein